MYPLSASNLPPLASKKRYCISVLSSPRIDAEGNDRSVLASSVDLLVAELEGRWDDVTLVVFNTASNWSTYESIQTIASKHPQLISDSRLILARPPYDEGLTWPALEDPSQLRVFFNDPMDRILWRSKTVLDYLHALHMCSNLGDYVLALDDDLIPTSRFLDKVDQWISTHSDISESQWFAINMFTTFRHADGEVIVPPCCNQAYLIQAADVPLFDATLRPKFDEAPLDLLLATMAKDSEDKKMYGMIPSLFQHQSILSSFAQNGLRTTISSPSFLP